MIELRTFGALDLRGSHGRELRTVIAQPKRLALLVYLAAATPGPFHRRDTLLGLFWPDVDAGRGRASLSRAVHYLRGALGDGVLLSRGDEELGLSSESFSVDAAQFRDLITRGRPADALELYRGDFMAGFFLSDAPLLERWIETERQGFRERAASAARSLSMAAEASGDIPLALHWAKQGGTLAPYDENELRRVLRLFERTGERASAAEFFQRFAQRLHDDLGIEPSPETVGLARAIAATPNESPTPPTPAASSPAVERPPIKSAPPTRRRWGRPRLSALAALSFVVLGASLIWRGEFRRRSPTDLAPFIVVLPLANESADTNNRYFSDGMTDELIAALSQVKGLRVASRTSAFMYRNRNVGVADIARALHVNAVLEGSAREQGDRVRIMLQLVRAPEGYGIWSKTYDRERRDAFALQREISRDVADALALRLAPASAAARHRSTDPETYDLYLWGRFYWTTRTQQSLLKSVAFFRRAIARDSNYAPAYSGLAEAYGLLGLYGLPREEIMAEAKANALHALALDESESEAHAALGYIATTYDWDWDSAERHLRRALELSPSNAAAHHWYSLYLTATGHLSEAIAQIDTACELDPTALLLRGAAGNRYFYARDFAGAIQRYEPVVKVTGDSLPAYLWLGLAYLRVGRVADALTLLEPNASESHARPERLAVLSIAYATAGRRRDGLALLRGLEERADREGIVGPSWVARAYAAFGENGRALTWLERAADVRDDALVAANVDPSLDALRNEPRFRVILRRMKLQ